MTIGWLIWDSGGVLAGCLGMWSGAMVEIVIGLAPVSGALVNSLHSVDGPGGHRHFRYARHSNIATVDNFQARLMRFAPAETQS